MAEEMQKDERELTMDDFADELEESLRQYGSTKRADMAAWEKLQDDLDNKLPVEVEITEAVKGGVTTTLEGVRAFIPASKLSLSYVDEKALPDFVGKRMTVQVITADPAENRLVLSAKDLLRAEAEKARAEKTAALQVGTVCEGTVETLKDYGAFVSLEDGVTGLLHVSQISQKRIKSPSAVLKEGQKVTVQIIGLKDGKISLSMKSLETAKIEKEEAEENESFHENYHETGAMTTSFGELLKKSGFKL